MRYYVSVEADFDQSFTYLVNVLKLLENKEEHILYASVVGDAYFIAYWINQIQHDLTKAEQYLNMLVDHAAKYEMKELLIKAKMSVAELTQHKGDVKKAIIKFKSLEKEITASNDSVLLNRLYLLMSNAFTVDEKVDSAFIYAKKAYKVVPIKNAQLKAFSTIHLARGYMEHDSVPKAIELAKEALQVVEDLEAKKEIKDINYFLAEANKGAANYQKALEHLEKFMELDKEQASLLSAANISNLEAKLADEKHDYELKLKQTEIEVKNKQTIALIVFLVLALGFIIVVIRGYNIKKRDAETIRNQKIIVEEKNKEILDSISYAKRIQTAILPPDKIVKEYLEESFILYKPKDIVAGDFYWMESVPGLGKNDSPLVLFAAADCTGHGVPGAMVSVVCNNGLNRAVREFGLTDPGKILDKTCEIVVQEFEKSEDDVRDGMDIALCSLSVNSKQSLVLQYAGAHNPLWIVRTITSSTDEGSVLRSEELEEHLSLATDNCLLYEIKADKQPIGKFYESKPYTTHTVELKQGDTFYVFSDGFADQFGGEKGKKIKKSGLKQLLLSIQHMNMNEQKKHIDQTFENWKGTLEQIDDVCVIGVRV